MTPAPDVRLDDFEVLHRLLSTSPEGEGVVLLSEDEALDGLTHLTRLKERLKAQQAWIDRVSEASTNAATAADRAEQRIKVLEDRAQRFADKYPSKEGSRLEALEESSISARANSKARVEGCTCLRYVDGLGDETGRVRRSSICPVHARALTKKALPDDR